MKKTRQTTSDTLSMKRIVGGVWAFVFFVAALLCIVLQLAQSQGGGIEAEVRGHGIARQVQCARDGAALWTGWTCRVGEIIWAARGNCPSASSRNRRHTPCWRPATGAGANLLSAAICRWTGERRVAACIRRRPEKSSSRRGIRPARVAGGQHRCLSHR